MKSKRLGLTACLLAGAIIISTGGTTALAAGTDFAETPSIAGFSLALADFDQKSSSKLIEDAQMEADEAAKRAVLKAEEEAAYYANIGVAQVNDYVNVRSEASTDSEIVGRMENNAVATVTGSENGWYQITSGSISGYILADYLTVGNAELVNSVRTRMATVHTQTLKVRSEASAESGVLMLVSDGEQFSVLDESVEGWVKINTSEGEGYVSSEFVTVEDTFLYAKKPQQVSGGQAAAQYGLQFVGNPYVWGGTSLTNGADCSGFIMSVYAHFGVSLPHSSAAMRGCGTEVSYSEAQPGDIICYSGHVALYIGNGQVVHAANERKGITVSSATHKSIITVRRIFN